MCHKDWNVVLHNTKRWLKPSNRSDAAVSSSDASAQYFLTKIYSVYVKYTDSG